MMTSVDHLQTGLIRWLSSPGDPLIIDIDHHPYELIKAAAAVVATQDIATECGGKGCVVTCDVGVETTDVSPEFLLQLTQAGLGQFVGILSMNERNQYIVSKWLSLSGNATEDSHKILGLIESLSNQTAVWRDLIATSLTRKRQLNRNSQLSHNNQNRPNACQKAPSRSLYTSMLPLTLSQQLQIYQGL